MTPRCENTLGKRGPCNEPLRAETNALGALRYRCLRCEARAEGRCWQCGKPRANHKRLGVYCDHCAFLAYRQAQQRADASEERRRQRKLYDQRRRKDPTYRQQRAEAVRAFFDANPQKRAEYREKARERHRAAVAAYRAQHPDHAASHEGPTA